MLMDYLIASVIGVAGMLGLLQLGAEVTALHQQSFQLSVAESVVRELSSLLRFVEMGSVISLEVCTNPTGPPFEDTCRMVTDWLSFLPEYRLDALAEGDIKLSWRHADGDRLSLRFAARPL
jgi:hypothetical protein